MRMCMCMCMCMCVHVLVMAGAYSEAIAQLRMRRHTPLHDRLPSLPRGGGPIFDPTHHEPRAWIEPSELGGDDHGVQGVQYAV